MKRFLRDAGILLAFLGAFYCLTIFVGRLDGDSSNQETDFSIARKRADFHLNRKDWNSAAAEFRNLTTLDPYDGHAWFNYAYCYYYLRYNAIKKLNKLAAVANPDPYLIEVAMEEVRYNTDQAHGALLRAKDFARYREQALLRLAIIETARNNYTVALDFLEEYIDEGYFTKEGLDRYVEFGALELAKGSTRNKSTLGVWLHGESRFWDLVRREAKLRQSR